MNNINAGEMTTTRMVETPTCHLEGTWNTSTPYLVKITQVSNGFIIVVGCKTFVAKNWTEASKGLAEYYKNPAAAEKKYCKKG